jgi:phosphoenolpyruvate carboxylase
MFRSRVTMDESSKVAAQTGRSYPTMFGFSDSHRDGSFWGGWHLAKEMKKLALSANRLSVAAPILFGCAHNPLRGHAGNLEMFRGSYISNSNAFGFLSQGDDTLMLLLTALTGRSWLSHRCLPDHREDIAFQAPYADLLDAVADRSRELMHALVQSEQWETFFYQSTLYSDLLMKRSVRPEVRSSGEGKTEVTRVQYNATRAIGLGQAGQGAGWDDRLTGAGRSLYECLQIEPEILGLLSSLWVKSPFFRAAIIRLKLCYEQVDLAGRKAMAQSVDTSVSKPILDTYRRCLEQGVVAIARITETKWKPDSRKWSMAASLRKEQARLWTARMRLSQNLDRYGANVEAALKDDPHRPALKEISRAVLAAMNTSG